MADAGYRDRFSVEESIGSGGFAEVFRARDLTSGQVVALKILKENFLGNSTIVERFRREVFAIASISSPHVVALHDFGISGHEVWLAMEFVEGVTLREVIADRDWNLEEIHLVIGQIAQALSAAHRRGIVHRDLKPENVMLVPGSDGRRRVKVLDFGLAKLAELEHQLDLEPLTRVGLCFGTPQYMAPELIEGRPFDHSADLFALGVLTWEMLTGVLPWDGDDATQVMMKVAQSPLPPLPPVDAVRRADIEAFLRRALSKRRRERPSDAAAFFHELELALFAAPRPLRLESSLSPPSIEDESFASVWAASLDLPEEGEDTEVDPSPTQRPSRRLRSGWLKSVAELVVQTHPDDIDEGATRPFNKADLPDGPGFEKARLERTDPMLSRRAPAQPEAAAISPWLVLLVGGLVLCALAAGFWLGRH